MKATICTVALIAQALFAWGIEEDPLTMALVRGAEVNIGIRVVDDEGTPVADAECCGWIYLERDAKHGCQYSATTDNNGEFRIVGKTSEWVSVNVSKEGYYRTQEKIVYPDMNCASPVVDGKWQPYGEIRTVVLKRIKKPGRCVIPKQGGQFAWNIPAFGEWVGFDFEEFDWTSPYGRGKSKDVILKFQGKCNKRFVDYEYEMDVCFTNHPYAGAYVCDLAGYSDFKTQYHADTNGAFQTSFRFVLKKSSTQRVMECVEQNQYLVFRTRTKVGDDGKLKAAHYGALLGMWSFSDKQMSVGDACFNIVENDTNIEDGRTLRDKIKNYAKRK